MERVVRGLAAAGVACALVGTAVSPAAAATTCAAGAWAVDFFGGTALAGTPLVSRCDGAVGADWGGGSRGRGGAR